MPIYPGEVCPVCGENPNISYLCNDCKQIFCEDCLDIKAVEKYVCGNCGSENVITVDGKTICAECHSDYIKTTKDIIGLCPNCESTNIIKIEDKQNELIQKYKDIINNTRNFIKPLEETGSIIYGMKNKLFDLRESHPPMLHYPNTENELILLHKLFTNIENNIYNEVNNFFNEILKNIHYIAEIPQTHPSNLPYIEEILHFFDSEYDKVLKLSESSVQNLHPKIDPINKDIEFMQSIQTLFKRFLGLFNLEDDEKVVFGIECKLAGGENEKDNISKKKGTILITSRRIHFFHERGVFKKRNVLLFSVDLQDLQEVDVKGKLTKKVSLDFVNGMYQFKLSKSNRDELIKWIKRARKFDSTNILDESNYRKLKKVKIDLRQFKEELENAIYELIGFHGSIRVGASYDDVVEKSNRVINARMYRNGTLYTPKPSSISYNGGKTEIGPKRSNIPSSILGDSRERFGGDPSVFDPTPGELNIARTLIGKGHLGYPHQDNGAIHPFASKNYGRSANTINMNGRYGDIAGNRGGNIKGWSATDSPLNIRSNPNGIRRKIMQNRVSNSGIPSGEMGTSTPGRIDELGIPTSTSSGSGSGSGQFPPFPPFPESRGESRGGPYGNFQKDTDDFGRADFEPEPFDSFNIAGMDPNISGRGDSMQDDASFGQGGFDRMIENGNSGAFGTVSNPEGLRIMPGINPQSERYGFRREGNALNPREKRPGSGYGYKDTLLRSFGNMEAILNRRADRYGSSIRAPSGSAASTSHYGISGIDTFSRSEPSAGGLGAVFGGPESSVRTPSDAPSGSMFMDGGAFNGRGTEGSGMVMPGSPPGGAAMDNRGAFYGKVNEEFKIKRELHQLEQDRFAVSNTVKMIERHLEGGRMSYEEFIKNYRELQRQLYRLNSRIKYLRSYLNEKYDTQRL